MNLNVWIYKLLGALMVLTFKILSTLALDLTLCYVGLRTMFGVNVISYISPPLKPKYLGESKF